jgi:sulfite reductase (NADPH) flavoprotein alpha-component
MDTITKIKRGASNNGKPVASDSVLYVIYGSRTGNSKAAATLAHEYADYLGMQTDLLDMKTFRFDMLKQMKNILIAVSTHGEGDPPAVVEDFYRFMHSSEAPSMAGVNFSVLALGDSSYKDFAKPAMISEKGCWNLEHRKLVRWWNATSITKKMQKSG